MFAEGVKKVTDTERSLIGLLFVTPERASAILAQLPENCFSDCDGQEVVGICRKLIAQCSALDFITVSEMVTFPHARERLTECCELAALPGNEQMVVAKVIEDWRKRIFGKAMREAAIDCEAPGPIRDIIVKVRAELAAQDAIDQTIKAEGAKTFHDAYTEFYLQLSEPDTSLKTGWRDFDLKMGGFQRGGLYAISARTGAGKTDLALNLAIKFSKKFTVVYCSQEMPRAQIMRRVVSRATKINNIRLRDRNLSPEEYAELNKAYALLKEHTHLVIDEGQSIDIAGIEQRIVKYRPDALFIDHLGLMKHPQRKNQWEGIAETTKALKALAMKYKIVLFELVQRSREADKQKGTPTMSELRGGGSVEADADAIITITAVETQDRVTGQPYRDATLHILKNRHGCMGEVKFNYWPQYSNFVPIEASAEKGCGK